MDSNKFNNINSIYRLKHLFGLLNEKVLLGILNIIKNFKTN